MYNVMLQEQYIFLHDAILEQVTCGDTQINARELQSALQHLAKVNRATKSTGLHTQFQVSIYIYTVTVDSSINNTFKNNKTIIKISYPENKTLP